MLGLGMSVRTPKGGIEAEVLVVSSFAELTARAAEAKGKIVLYDAPFVNYGATVQYRGAGANVASMFGAIDARSAEGRSAGLARWQGAESAHRTVAEVAEVLRVPEGTIRSDLSRARAVLQSRMEVR